MSRTLVPHPLTAEAFAPYGDVIEASDRAERFEINYGAAVRYQDLARIDADDEGGRAGISLFRSKPQSGVISIELMERHPLGSQAFVPLSGRPYLVLVAPPGELDPNAIEAFRAAPGQGVNYAKGTWHHFLLALEADSDFLVIDRLGPGGNFDEVRLAEPLSLTA